jgi:hypothetical protein
MRAQAPAETLSVAPALPQRGDSGGRRATPKRRALDDAEQRVADGITFAPRVTERFVVAARNKQILGDVGRVGLPVTKDASLLPVVEGVA